VKIIFSVITILASYLISYFVIAVTYNRTLAIEYADYWCDKHNPEYYFYCDGDCDCANFVSQCLIAGGLDLSAGADGRGAGIDDKKCIPYCDDLHLHFIGGYHAIKWEMRYKGEPEPSWLVPGDVAILGKYGEDHWKHAVFAVAVEDDIMQYDAHSNPQCHEPISIWFNDPATDVDICYYYHIESEPPPPPTAWTVHQFDIVNSGCNPNAKTLSNAISTSRCTIYSTPAIQNDVMYLHDCHNQVIAYSVPDGFYLWHQADYPGSLNSEGAKAVALINNKLILRVMGYVYAVNTASEKHEILWEQVIGGGYSAPVVKDNKIYIQGYYGGVTKIYCLNPGTGDVLENPIEIKDDVEISIGGNNLYVACLYLQEITAIDLDLFKIRWTQQNIPGHVYSPVVPVGDKIYLSVLEHQLTTQQQAVSADNMLVISLSEGSPQFQKGDVSMDGQITAHDAQLIMQYVVGQTQLSAEQKELADVSGNGQISGYDAGLVMQMTTGLKKE